MRSFGKFVWDMKTIVFPILILVQAAIFLFLSGKEDAAYMLSALGPLLVILLNALYVVYSSANRWPNTPWLQRLGRITLYKR